MVDKGFSVIHACKAAMSFLSKEVSGLHFALVSPSCDPHPPLSLFPEEQFVPNAPTRKNVSPDLANGKGTGPSPALGRNRGGSFVQRTHFLEHLRPSAKVKSLVEISPCSPFSFFSCLFLPFLRPPLQHIYGGSQARGLIGAVAAALHHSHSNSGSEPHLRPAPQLTATLDP